jgi:hypothetical protein
MRLARFRRSCRPARPAARHGERLRRPDLLLDVSLDPQSRQFKAEAELQPGARSFRFLLHESLRVTSARAGNDNAGVDSASGPRGYRQWTVRLAQPGQTLRIRYEGQLPLLERNRDHRSVLGACRRWRRPKAVSGLGQRLVSPPGRAVHVSGQARRSPRPARPGGRQADRRKPAGSGRRKLPGKLRMRQPSDGIDLMAGPWIVREKTLARPGQAPIYLRTFFPADLDAQPGLAQGYLDDSAAYIERYSRAIGAYPYSEFSIVASPLPTGFGMPTLTYLGAEVLRLPFIRKTSLGHEILHNWWGNGVYVDYQRGNWSEGLTTFMADYAYKEDESASAASEMRLAWLRDAAVFAGKTPARCATSAPAPRRRRHARLWQGSDALRHAARSPGQPAFDQGIRNFWAAQRFRIAGWDDLQAAFESASGEKLGAFFAAWLDQPALPDVAIAHAESTAVRTPGSPPYQLTIRFRKQDARLPLRLPVEISGAGQRETRWVELDAERNTATIPLAFAPQTLRLDPDMRVWRRLQASQLPPILRQWMAGRSPQLVDVARGRRRARRSGNWPGDCSRTARITGAGPAEQRPERQKPFCSPARTPRSIRPWPAPGCRLARPAWPGKAAPRCGPCRASPTRWPSSPPRTRRRSMPCNAACPIMAGKAGWFSSRARHRQRHLAGRHP